MKKTLTCLYLLTTFSSTYLFLFDRLFNFHEYSEKQKQIVEDLDRQGLLVEKGAQIETTINGLDTTIRVQIVDGKILMINGFIGYSNDVLGKLIKYTYKEP